MVSFEHEEYLIFYGCEVVEDFAVLFVWGRVFSISYGDNSFYVSVDDGDRALWDTPIINTWIWDQVNDRPVADPVAYFLTAGEHTLTIHQKEYGTKLDRILITNDLEYVPNE